MCFCKERGRCDPYAPAGFSNTTHECYIFDDGRCDPYARAGFSNTTHECLMFAGPMLLFERYSQYKKVKSFYACAASRDRKSCTAYIEKHEKDKKVKLC